MSRDFSDLVDFFSRFANIDKIVHISIFAFLGFTFRLSFPKQMFVVFIQIMLCYALLTEIMQDEIGLGRTLEFYDLICNIVGVLLGYIASKVFFKFYGKLENV